MTLLARNSLSGVRLGSSSFPCAIKNVEDKAVVVTEHDGQTICALTERWCKKCKFEQWQNLFGQKIDNVMGFARPFNLKTQSKPLSLSGNGFDALFRYYL